MALNLEKQLRFYGSYHNDPVSVAIHITCVPAILMTAFLFGTSSGAVSLPESVTVQYLPLNVGTAACLVYAAFYLLLDPVAGGLVAPLLIGGTAYANYLTSTYGSTAYTWALGIHVASWIAQFVGHGKFEGRAPALLDNLVQAFFLAPFFVWLEILFFFGYRPELKKKVDTGVAQDIQSFKKGKSNGVAATNGHVKKSS